VADTESVAGAVSKAFAIGDVTEPDRLVDLATSDIRQLLHEGCGLAASARYVTVELPSAEHIVSPPSGRYPSISRGGKRQ